MSLSKTPIYGLPISPAHLIEELAGASFCVSFGTRKRLGKQLNDAIRLIGQDGILLVDNGAFTMFKQGVTARDEAYLEAYEAWALEILGRCPQAIAVIPDVIGGTEQENAELVRTTLLPCERAMPIWHMHESLEYFLYLCESFDYVGIGSSGDFWQCGTEAWNARIAEMFAALEARELADDSFLRPRLHMMRAQAQAHGFDFDSSDSSNVAVNHCRYKHEGAGYVAAMARRVSAKIVASSGPEAAHQVARPFLFHVEAARLEAARFAQMAADHAELTEALFAPELIPSLDDLEDEVGETVVAAWARDRAEATWWRTN